MSELPKGWNFSKLGDLCEPSQYGYTAKAGTSGNIHFLRTTDITSGAIDWKTVPYCYIDEKNREKYILNDGDIVISRAGSVGFSYLINKPKPSIFASYLIRFRPKIDSAYFKYFLLTPEYWKQISEQSLGIAVQNVNASSLSEIRVPVAPAAEQTRIVTKLEELLTDLDHGVAELKAAQKKLGQYRQSLLKAAVEGQLTAHWRAQQQQATACGQAPETGAQLLARILTERRQRWEAKQRVKFAEQGKTPPKNWQSKYPEPVQPDTTGLPELPQGWVWASVDQLSELITSGSRGWADYYSNSGATFIRSQNINKDFLDLTDIAYVMPPEGGEGSRTKVEIHDLLLTITGANVGKAAHVKSALAEAYVSQHVALIRPVDKSISIFLHLYLTAEAGGRGQLNKWAYGAGKPGLNLQQVGSVLLPICSSHEREELEKILMTQFTAIDEQLISITQALKQATAQRQNILRAAFAGELVPQDPNDEPASVLLERIRAEQSAAQAAGAGKKPKTAPRKKAQP